MREPASAAVTAPIRKLRVSAARVNSKLTGGRCRLGGNTHFRKLGL